MNQFSWPKDAFIENGFANTSMDDIAARAGTTKRTICNNFNSKERLLEAVIDYAIKAFEAAVPQLDVNACNNQLTNFCEMLLQLVTWRAAVWLQRMIIAEGLSFPSLVQHRDEHNVSYVHSAVALTCRGGSGQSARSVSGGANPALSGGSRSSRRVNE